MEFLSTSTRQHLSVLFLVTLFSTTMDLRNVTAVRMQPTLSEDSKAVQEATEAAGGLEEDRQPLKKGADSAGKFSLDERELTSETSIADLEVKM
eukprot:GSA25T00021169001.1